MAVDNIYTYDPIKYNNLNQAQSGYPGIDKVENYILKEGTILVALEGPKAGAGGNYFMTLDEFKNSNLDSINLCQGLQVAPYYDKRNKDSQPQYKTNARFYIINEEILSAEGAISANTNYGKGGLQQIVVPNGSEMIKEAYRNDEHSLNDNIIPIDLNKFENDERISGKTKEELNSVKNKFFDNLSDDGSIQLNNKVISEQTYDLIQMRTEIHELTAKNNCLLKEYTDELQKEDKDINYISKISNQISNNESKLNYKKYDFEKNCEYLNEKSSLLDGFTDEQKEHMLNADTCCPKETLEKSEYLKAKASELEKNLSYDEKKLLNIEDDVSSDKLNDFKENTKLEESIKEDYENYTSLDPEGIVNRKLIYTPIEKDKNEDTDGRRTALGEKDQLYEENSSDQAKNMDAESSKVYENVKDNENTTENKKENNKNKLESKEELLEEVDYKNINEDKNLEVHAQENIIEEQIINEKHDENLEINKELENNEVSGKIKGNKEKNETMDQDENSNKNDRTSSELSSDNKVDIENDEIKVIDEAEASEVSEEHSGLKDVNENLEQNENYEDGNFETSEISDDNNDVSIVESTQTENDQQAQTDIEAGAENIISRGAEKVDIEYNEETNNSELNANDCNNDMLNLDANLEKMDNENCDENEELKDCDEETIESSVNFNSTPSNQESDEDLDEDEDEFYDY
ncbi:hypothetical protein [Clostridium guangxiense]|uniref:hypothetical protein n=1 Tax=Clostridium guangxiense TaxID=1662055 RepID=UPI001E556E8E|nr:hypothetical protein [Clostridium guangxiense]MCD2348822.1 hypothetical protein [Clostridium guangxiense]